MEKKKNNKKLIIIIAIVFIVIVAIISGIVFYKNSDLSKDYYYFLQDGEYQKAYEKAKNENEKQEIIKQNAVEYVCKLAFNGNTILTSGSKLENAWYDNEKNIVIYLSNEDYTNGSAYLYFSFNQKNKDYDFICISKKTISIDNITLSDTYTTGIKNSGYEKAIQKIAIDTLKKNLPDKLSKIMTKENEIGRRNRANIQGKITLIQLNDSSLLDVEN